MPARVGGAEGLGLPPLPTASASTMRGKSFQVIVHGVVDGAECVEVGTMFARTQLFFGPDWAFLTGTDIQEADQEDDDEEDLVVPTYSNNAEVVTQLSDCAKSPIPYFSWTTPFEFALTSTNPYGWPQLVITLHTITGGGGSKKAEKKKGAASNAKDSQLLGSGESIIGYGRCFIPMQNGYHTTIVPVMQLENATAKHQLISLLTREQPVLRDLSYLCRGDDQVMLNARPLDGYVKLNFSVLINGMESCGFDV